MTTETVHARGLYFDPSELVERPSEVDALHLANRAYFNSVEARDTLVRGFLRYTMTYTYRVFGRKYPHLIDDIRSAALLALVKASSSYSPRLTCPYTTWLKRVIIPEVRAVILSGGCPCELPYRFAERRPDTWEAVYGRWKRGNACAASSALALLNAMVFELDPVDRPSIDWVQSAIDRATLDDLITRLSPVEGDIITSSFGFRREEESPKVIAQRHGVMPQTITFYRRRILVKMQRLAGLLPERFYAHHRGLAPGKSTGRAPRTSFRRDLAAC